MIENVTGKGPDQRFRDRPASHAVAHADGLPCSCHGKTEAEIAMPYAAFAFALPVLAIIGAVIGWALR